MKTKYYRSLVALASLALFVLTSEFSTARAQGTAFTYQGRLNNSSGPANGFYDFEFSLYPNSAGTGSKVGSTIAATDIVVTNGLFSVALDFGDVFSGNDTWLAVSVRSNGVGSYTGLTPLQELTPTPYAIFATTSSNVSGTLPASQITGTIPLSQLPATVSLLSDPGTQNLFAGLDAGNATSPGTYNTAIGFSALNVNTGSYNSALGNDAMAANTTGTANTADGVFTLWKNTTGGNNTAYGADAMAYNISGSQNTAVGQGADENNTNGSANVALGALAMGNGIGGSDDTALGFEALENNSTGFQNTATGYGAMSANLTGSYNTATGVGALSQSTADTYNTAFGGDALAFDNGGSYNTACGSSALGLSTTGNNNTAVGYGALTLNGAGNNNTAVGYEAAGGATGPSAANTALGGLSIHGVTTGYNNTGAGYQSLEDDTTGFDNVGIGVATFQVNSAGFQNTGVGTYAFQSLTAGTGNVGLGVYAGYYLTAGSNNIYIGNYGSSADNNLIRIGNGQTKTYINSGSVGINNNNPTEALDVGGEFIAVEGATPVRCYIGDDGSGNDVQVGSLKSGITAVSLYNEADSAYMHLYCSSISIEGGSDLAEPFAISTQDEKVTEGEVVIIDEDHPGHLKRADRAYDTRVAGVVSGANGINPGIQMEQQGLLEGNQNVALTGRVYVQADASNGAIRPGDLLTTSDTPGHAMKVGDHLRAQGAILGKAMTGLKEGKGMVLVLVTLQ
jgi:hypothetical protein